MLDIILLLQIVLHVQLEQHLVPHLLLLVLLDTLVPVPPGQQFVQHVETMLMLVLLLLPHQVVLQTMWYKMEFVYLVYQELPYVLHLHQHHVVVVLSFLQQPESVLLVLVLLLLV